MTTLFVQNIGPAVTVQDLGRPGRMAQGLSRGGAMDRLAVLEATALLGAKTPLPAFEMAGVGGTFRVSASTRFALTGAKMQAFLDDEPLIWQASHLMKPSQVLKIGGVLSGVYGYLTFAGGLAGAGILDSHATHVTAGIGAPIKADTQISLIADPDPLAGPNLLPHEPRFTGGVLRVMPGPQTGLFSEHQIAEISATRFARSHVANRQGVRLDHDTLRIQSTAAAGLASDFVVPGDVQLTGEGVPYVLMAECQTMGGYPRIGTVVPQDLPKVAQAPVGADIQLQFLSLAEADAQMEGEASQLARLRSKVAPRVRDPHDIADLLRYQLISGVTSGDDLGQ